MWSPGLIPKPEDWGPEIDIAGFVFLDLASSFKPPETLAGFLDAGEPPVYISFGSIVIDDPDKFTTLIFEAVKNAGVRALVSKGWGGLGDEENTPNKIYMLENTRLAFPSGWCSRTPWRCWDNRDRAKMWQAYNDRALLWRSAILGCDGCESWCRCSPGSPL